MIWFAASVCGRISWAAYKRAVASDWTGLERASERRVLRQQSAGRLHTLSKRLASRRLLVVVVVGAVQRNQSEAASLPRARARAKVNSISATLLCAQFNIRHPNGDDDDDDVNSLRPIHMSGLPFGRTFCARALTLSQIGRRRESSRPLAAPLVGRSGARGRAARECCARREPTRATLTWFCASVAAVRVVRRARESCATLCALRTTRARAR